MDQLDLRVVGYFIAVAEELHFGRAAERLHIAQPSLSQQIRRLEAQLGVALLTRNSRHVELTAAGKALLEEGRQLVSHAQHAIQTTRAAGGPLLTVGFYGSAATNLLPGTLRAFGERKPSIAVSVRELPLGRIDEILDGDVNIAFTRLLPGQTKLEVEVLSEEPRVLAVASAHPLAARKSVAFADLRAESFIVNPAEPTDGAPPRWLNEQRERGLPGRIALESSSIQEILTLVSAGRGICLVPSTVAKHYPRDDVAYVAVTDATPAVVSLAWRQGPVCPAVETFIQVAREAAADKSSKQTRV